MSDTVLMEMPLPHGKSHTGTPHQLVLAPWKKTFIFATFLFIPVRFKQASETAVLMTMAGPRQDSDRVNRNLSSGI